MTDIPRASTPLAAAVSNFRLAFRNLEREMNFYLGAQADCCGLGIAQCHLLLEIASQGSESIGFFASRLDLDSSTVSRTADSLVKNGYLDRQDDPGNRRRQILSLSTKGQRRAAEIDKVCDSWYGDILSKMDEDDRATLLRLLPKLAESMRRFRDAAGSCCAIAHSDAKTRKDDR